MEFLFVRYKSDWQVVHLFGINNRRQYFSGLCMLNVTQPFVSYITNANTLKIV